MFHHLKVWQIKKTVILSSELLNLLPDSTLRNPGLHLLIDLYIHFAACWPMIQLHCHSTFFHEAF